MKTSVESLEDSKVRLHVEIPAAEFEQAVNAAFTKLAQEVKLPGFRPGKVPRQVLEARIGTDAAREQALQDALPDYYAEAVLHEGVDAIAPPDIEITGGQHEGDVVFEAVVEIRPRIELRGYEGLRAVLSAPEVPDEEIDAQVDRLREQFADLEESGRPLSDGDYAQIDLRGSAGDELVEGLSASDFLYEVGSAGLLPRLDEELRGKKPGDILEFTETLPEWFGERAGQEVSFRVLVRDAKRKVLPDLDDEWVSEASEFETVEELRSDVRRRLEVVRKVQTQVELRDRLLEELAGLVEVEAPEALVQQETERRLHDLLHRLEGRGVSLPQYIEASGLSQQEFVARVQEGAERAVKADLALRAIVEQEGIGVTPDEVDAEVARLAERVERDSSEVRAELERGGGIEAVRSEVARGKALQHVVDRAEVVDDAGNPLDLTIPEDLGAPAATGTAATPETPESPETPETDSDTDDVETDAETRTLHDKESDA